MSKRSVRVLRTAFDLGVIVSLTVAFAHFAGALSGFPKGGDVEYHLTYLKFTLDNWPYIDWFPYHYSGFPTFLLYPPQPYLIWAALVAITGLSAETALNVLALSSFTLLEISVYIFLLRIGCSHNAALLAPLLIMSSPAYWSQWFASGVMARVLGIGFLGLLLLFFHYFDLKGNSAAHQKTIIYLFLVFFGALSLSSHLQQGLITLGLLLSMAIVSRRAWPERLAFMIKIGLPIFFLSSYFYLPFLRVRPPAGYGAATMGPVSFERLLWNDFVSLNSLSPFSIPLLIFLLCVLAFLRRKSSTLSNQTNFALTPALRAFGLILIVLSIYIFGGNLPFYPKSLYLKGVYPHLLMFFVALFLAIECAILFSKVVSSVHHWMRSLMTVSVLALAWLSVIMACYFSTSYINDRSDSTTWNSISKRIMVIPEKERNYRFGTDSAETAIWFNYEYSTPQTRGYSVITIPYPNWDFWLSKAGWGDKDNYPETNFLFDWYAVKWFLVGEPHFNYQKFLAKPEFYTLIRADEVHKAYFFGYWKPSPILSATDAHDLLVTSNKDNYEVLLRDLSVVNYNSQRVIPLRGKEYIDDLTLDELSQFDLIILYGFDYRDQEKAFGLLADYVREGGGLIVEVNGSPLDNASSIPEPIPVSHTTATNYGTEWNFTRAEHEILEGIDLSAFGPAIYDGGPWGVSSAEEADIRNWAQPILFTNGHPIIVAGQYGQGRVVWTGMNLPYHILSHRNQEESRFLAQIIEWVAGEGHPQPDYEAHFIHPQRRAVKVLSPAKGVLFKESFFPNWHAYVEGRELKIYRAGPDFMYVALPKDTPYPVEVILEYKKSNLEWISLGISLVTLLGLAAYAIKRCP